MKRIKEISCGFLHTLFLNEDGEVFSTGYNGNGQLGQGDDVQRRHTPQKLDLFKDMKIKQISTKGGYHSLFLTTEGVVYSCGDNHYGQTGLGTFDLSRQTPQKIIFPETVSKVLRIYTGYRTSFFLVEKKDGTRTVFVCGASLYNGELGNGKGRNIEFPEECSIFRSRKKTKGVGRPTSENDDDEEDEGEVDSGDLGDLEITSGSVQTMFFFDGKVIVVGKNENGELGMGEEIAFYEPTEFDFDHPIKEIRIGKTHGLIVTTDGRLFGFGSNEYGQLGTNEKVGKRKRRKERRPQGIQNLLSQIRQKKNDEKSEGGEKKVDEEVNWFKRRPFEIDIGFLEEGEVIVKIFVQMNHSLFVTSKGNVYGCGKNDNCQLFGSNEGKNRFNLMKDVMVICQQHELISCKTGNDFCMFLCDGRVFGKGFNGDGQLGTGDNQNKNKLTKIN